MMDNKTVPAPAKSRCHRYIKQIFNILNSLLKNDILDHTPEKDPPVAHFLNRFVILCVFNE